MTPQITQAFVDIYTKLEMINFACGRVDLPSAINAQPPPRPPPPPPPPFPPTPTPRITALFRRYRYTLRRANVTCINRDFRCFFTPEKTLRYRTHNSDGFVTSDHEHVFLRGFDSDCKISIDSTAYRLIRCNARVTRRRYVA